MSNLSRAARQLLQDLRSAGLTHVPRAVVPEVEERAADVPSSSAGLQSAARSAPPPDRNVAASIRPSGRSTESAGAVGVVTGMHVRIPAASGNSKPNDDPLPVRQEKLQQLAQCVAGCERCSQLAQTRTRTVFGVGNPEAKIMFIGEAPGADEDRTGIPFVGRAGQLMDKIIEACGWKREELYICNILRCRPPGNRTPTETEAANCREYLDGQIAVVDPEYIVCWGSCAAQNLLGTKDPIGRMRQRIFQYGRAKVLCTYHPSYLLRNPSAKKPVWEDMKFLMAEMGHVPPAR